MLRSTLLRQSIVRQVITNKFHSATRFSAQTLERAPAAAHVTAPSDDRLLLQIFDTEELNPISPRQPSQVALTAVRTGLFKQPRLTTPADFPILAKRTILRAKLIVQKICLPAPTSFNSIEHIETTFLTMVKDLDRLSDLLCGVIDLAELVRNVHPEKAWNDGANEAYEVLCGYMNELNTNVSLYQALKSLHSLLPASTPSKSTTLFMAYAVATPFLRDFEKSGIHLPASQRDQFVTYSSDIIQLGRKFLLNAGEPKRGVQIERAEIEEAFGAGFARQVFTGGVLNLSKTIDPTSWEGRVIGRQHPDENLRRRIHVGANATDESHVEVLEDLLMTRARLAQLVGRKSWGEVALEDKMAKTPENVMGFLEKLNEVNLPLAAADLDVLQRAKKSHLNTYTKPKIHAWDKDFYTDYSSTSSSPIPDISPFFSLGTCFLGLSKLFTSLYGIRFEVEDLSPGEIWVEGVRKLKVIDEDEGRIGTIYCDLFDREGKQAGAAHYTVRCSRRIDDDNADSDFSPNGMGVIDDVGVARSELEGLDVNGVRWRGRAGVHQEPIIVLVCGFGNGGGGSLSKTGPMLLQWHEVETLFHEMGHAIHSMIGRTDFHNVSGTRCSTDFVELPSILMEHFIASPAVLATFAKHHKTGRVLPPFLLDALLQERKKFSALETSNQIMMATLDQQFHSDLPLQKSALSKTTGRFDSEKVLKQVHQDFHVIPHAPGTSWQTSFGHLFGYGSTYYSYLFDRAIAAKIYRQKFEADPVNRERGEEFKQGVLRWGGGKDPWEMVGSVTGDEEVMRGGKGAMERVGHWGIEESVRRS